MKELAKPLHWVESPLDSRRATAQAAGHAYTITGYPNGAATLYSAFGTSFYGNREAAVAAANAAHARLVLDLLAPGAVDRLRQHDELVVAVETARQEREATADRVTRLDSELHTLRGVNAFLAAHRDNLIEQRNRLAHANGMLLTERNAAREQRDVARSERDEARTAHQTAINEGADAIRERDIARDQRNAAQKEAAALRNAVGCFNQSDAVEKAMGLARTNTRLNEEIGELRAQVAGLESDRTALGNSLSRREQKLDEANRANAVPREMLDERSRQGAAPQPVQMRVYSSGEARAEVLAEAGDAVYAALDAVKPMVHGRFVRWVDGTSASHIDPLAAAHIAVRRAFSKLREAK